MEKREDSPAVSALALVLLFVLFGAAWAVLP